MLEHIACIRLEQLTLYMEDKSICSFTTYLIEQALQSR